MTLKQVKDAVALGKTVHWATDNYEVIHDSVGQYLIHCKSNDHYFGLTWTDGITMNGGETEFYIKK